MPPKKKPRAPLSSAGRKLNARPDTLDFRDLMYSPTLVDVPIERPLAQYREARVPILDQGREGACTGYGLATVVHYLLRTRRPKSEGTVTTNDTSPRVISASASAAEASGWVKR